MTSRLEMDELARKAVAAANTVETPADAVLPALEMAVTAVGAAMSALTAADELADELVLDASGRTGALLMWLHRFSRLLEARAEQLSPGQARLHACAALHGLNTTVSEEAAAIAVWLAKVNSEGS